MYYLIFVTHPSLKSAESDSVSIIIRQCNKQQECGGSPSLKSSRSKL